MKKIILRGLLIVFLLVVFPLLLLAGVLFVRPLLVINPQNLAWLLHRTHVFKEWSWSEARFTHERKSLFHRNFEGDFKNFCFHYDKEGKRIRTCMEKISWNFDLLFSFKKGLRAVTVDPFLIDSSLLEASFIAEDKIKEDTAPPDIWKYWKLFWAAYVPDMDFRFRKIVFHREKKAPLKFDLILTKTPQRLSLETLSFHVDANPDKIILRPPAKWPVPKDLGTTRPVYLKNFVLTALMRKEGITAELTGNIETIKVLAKSFIHLPLKGNFDSLAFRKDLLLKSSGEILLTGLKKSLRDYAPAPYNQLPAPLNVLDGDIIFKFRSEDRNKNSVFIKGDLRINLSNKEEAVDVNIFADVPLSLKDFSKGTSELGVEFNRLTLKLPRLSVKAPPPQFRPDSRFVKKSGKKTKKKKAPLAIDLVANEEQSLHIKSNLLDEPLRLNFNLHVFNGEVKKGYLKVLPLKTTVFKRPIRVEDLLITFRAPVTPVIKSTIIFPLPEYKVTLHLEGPVTKPRYVFQSDPPLPENDIYAVLLFGRPMNDLGPEDKANAGATNQVLSQGLLSLSTLYFLAGSPVEYVGFNRESNTATAQIGLGSKSSLQVSGGREGVNSTGIRRSLGKGWYIDTSVQSTNVETTKDTTRNYGVILERILAY